MLKKNNSQRIPSKLITAFLVICSITLLLILTVPAQTLESDDGETKGPTEGVLTGIIEDAVTNDPIPNVLMTLKYHDEVHTKLTDSKGEYTFTNIPLCFCLKNISASKSGYESQYQLVPVSEMTIVNFSLNPVDDPEEPEEPEDTDEPEDKPTPEPDDNDGAMYGVLKGFVTDNLTDEPIPNALMILKYHNEVHRVLTDSNGQYTFTKIPLCFCLKEISAQKDGYESEKSLVPVSEITYKNFTLEQKQSTRHDFEETDSNRDSDVISGQSSDRDESKGSMNIYFVILSLAGVFAVNIIFGIFIYRLKKKSRL